MMLHEGAGAHVLSAHVEVVIDNKDGRLPVDRDQVTIRRSIGLKKDEYFINSKRATKTEVAQLLETSGLSKNNPYNIVPQNKVNELTTMNEEKRLELIKDIAGVKVYDERRAESEKLMQETADKEAKVTEHLDYLNVKMKALEAEREELVQHQALDKKRKVLEYTYYDKELRRAKGELDKMDAQRLETSKHNAESSRSGQELLKGTKEAERKLKATRQELAIAQDAYATHEREHKALLKTVAQLDEVVKQSAKDGVRRKKELQSTSADLQDLDGQVAEAEARLAEGAEQTAAKRKEANRLQAEVEAAEAALQRLHSKQSRTQQFESKAQRDAHLGKEAGELKASLKKKDQQAAALKQELQAAQARLSESEQRVVAGRQRLQLRRTEAEAARAKCAELRTQRDAETDERKTLWRKEHVRERPRAPAPPPPTRTGAPTGGPQPSTTIPGRLPRATPRRHFAHAILPASSPSLHLGSARLRPSPSGAP